MQILVQSFLFTPKQGGIQMQLKGGKQLKQIKRDISTMTSAESALAVALLFSVWSILVEMMIMS